MGDNKKIDNDAEEYYAKYNGLWGETLSRLKNRLVFSRRCNDMLCIYCGEIAQTRDIALQDYFFLNMTFLTICMFYPLVKNAIKDFHRMKRIVRDYLNCIYERFCNKESEKDIHH